MATGNQGLGSDNMSQVNKDKIHSMGGKASSTTSSAASPSSITNKGGGGGLDKDAQKRGGQNGHRS